MKIAFGCDHRGYALKEALVAYAREQGHEPLDFGTDSAESCDYVDHAVPVACAVIAGEVEFGVLICYTGIGMSIAANKFLEVRAALATTVSVARMSREHNDANVLVIGAGGTPELEACWMLDAFISTPFEGGRHALRVEKIARIGRSKYGMA